MTAPSRRWRGRSVALVSLVTLAIGPAAAQTLPTPKQTVAPAQGADDLINPDRPGIADGSTVVGRGRVQLETGFQQESRGKAGATEHTRLLPTLLRVGLSPRWEGRVESNTFTQADTSGPKGVPNQTSGLAPISAGVKFHIQDSGGLRQPSLGMIFRVFPASGTSDTRTTRATGDVRLAAEWDLTPRISLNPNAGVAFYEDDAKRTFPAGLFALTLNYFNDAKTVNPFMDFGIQAPEASTDGASLVFDCGLAYLPNHNVQVDVSAGAGPHGRTPPKWFAALGVSVRFRASRN